MSKAADERSVSQRATRRTRPICDDIWFTRVGPFTNPTEKVDIDVDEATGRITGNYLKTDESAGDPIFGQCTEGTPGTEEPHLIQYERRDSTGAVIRTYEGRIFEVDLGLPGTPVITLIIGTSNVPKALNGGEDWMGGHTT